MRRREIHPGRTLLAASAAAALLIGALAAPVGAQQPAGDVLLRHAGPAPSAETVARALFPEPLLDRLDVDRRQRTRIHRLTRRFLEEYLGDLRRLAALGLHPERTSGRAVGDRNSIYFDDGPGAVDESDLELEHGRGRLAEAVERYRSELRRILTPGQLARLRHLALPQVRTRGFVHAHGGVHVHPGLLHVLVAHPGHHRGFLSGLHHHVVVFDGPFLQVPPPPGVREGGTAGRDRLPGFGTRGHFGHRGHFGKRPHFPDRDRGGSDGGR